MPNASEFGTGRCVLREGGDRPWVEIIQTFELLSDMDTRWGIKFFRGTHFNFHTCDYLPPRHLERFTQQLHQLIQTQQGEAVLYGLDQELELTVRVDGHGRGFLSVIDWNVMTYHENIPPTRSQVVIENLLLEDGGVQKLYEWVRDWTQLLQPGE